MSTLHYVAKSIDTIPGDQRTRSQLIVQTEEGDTVNVYLPARVELALRADAERHLRDEVGAPCTCDPLGCTEWSCIYHGEQNRGCPQHGMEARLG